MIVDALHPAAMTLVPARARNPRTVHVAARTAVEVEELPADAAEPWAGPAGRSSRWPGRLRVAGRTEAWSRAAWIGGPPLSRDDLRSILSTGDAEGFDVRGTPLEAWGDLGDVGGVQPRSPSTRGLAIDPDAARAIHADGRGRAAAAVRAHVRDTYLVVGDAVLVREVPYAAGYVRDRLELGLKPACEAIRLWSPQHVAACPSDLGPVAALAAASAVIGDVAAWSAFAPGGSATDGARIALDNHPAHVRRFLLRAADAFRRSGAAPDLFDAVMAEARALEPLEVEGMTGTCGIDDIGESLRILARAAGVAADPRISPGTEAQQARWIARLVDEVHLARLGATAHAEADADALGTLAPGR